MIKKNKPILLKFKKYFDKRGSLIPFESKKQKITIGNSLSFRIKRIFFSFGNKNYFRGNHAHKKCSQLLICLSGSINIETIYDSNKKKIFKISKNVNRALLIPPMVWNRIYFKTTNSLLAVLCDYKYDSKKEYIHNIDTFKKLIDSKIK
jgi:dTDP-4-dehydrorhamnose 3,5-epimerase-like enzyme